MISQEVGNSLRGQDRAADVRPVRYLATSFAGADEAILRSFAVAAFLPDPAAVLPAARSDVGEAMTYVRGTRQHVL